MRSRTQGRWKCRKAVYTHSHSTVTMPVFRIERKKRNFGLDKLPESRYTTQEITTKQREAHKMIKRDFLFLQIIRNMPEGSLCAMMLG